MTAQQRPSLLARIRAVLRKPIPEGEATRFWRRYVERREIEKEQQRAKVLGHDTTSYSRGDLKKS